MEQRHIVDIVDHHIHQDGYIMQVVIHVQQHIMQIQVERNGHVIIEQ